MNQSTELSNFDVKTSDLFLGMTQLEIFECCFPIGWFGPVAFMNIKTSIVEKIKLAQK